MNPGENNPSMNTGAGMGMTPEAAGAAGGDSPVPTTAPLDLTNMGATSETTGMSMADSLASAQDSLTSAGMAAQTMQGTSIGMDQITESAASATMEAPDEPLVPAAPVPGSIGSVTSVPPVDTVQTAGAGFAAAAQPEQPVAAPYNPFATATAQSSSTNIPTALQPPVEKFSAKGEKKKVNVLTLLLGGLAVLFAVTTVIFVVLWQNALNGQKVVYLPPVSDTPVTDTVALLACTRETQAAEGDLEGLRSKTNSVEANFKNDELIAIELVNGYTFENDEAAGATREHFDGLVAGYGEMGAEMSMLPITASFEINGATVTESLKANADQLVGGYVASFMLDDASVANGSLERVSAAYEGQGFSCAAE